MDSLRRCEVDSAHTYKSNSHTPNPAHCGILNVDPIGRLLLLLRRIRQLLLWLTL